MSQAHKCVQSNTSNLSCQKMHCMLDNMLNVFESLHSCLTNNRASFPTASKCSKLVNQLLHENYMFCCVCSVSVCCDGCEMSWQVAGIWSYQCCCCCLVIEISILLLQMALKKGGLFRRAYTAVKCMQLPPPGSSPMPNI